MVYQRNRKKKGEEECVAEHEEYRYCKMELAKGISVAKERCWKELIVSIDADSFGRPYQI